ncbi:hypothetical protein ACWF62_14790 [Rhodococcus sp. NPDC054953]
MASIPTRTASRFADVGSRTAMPTMTGATACTACGGPTREICGQADAESGLAGIARHLNGADFAGLFVPLVVLAAVGCGAVFVGPASEAGAGAGEVEDALVCDQVSAVAVRGRLLHRRRDDSVQEGVDALLRERHPLPGFGRACGDHGFVVFVGHSVRWQIRSWVERFEAAVEPAVELPVLAADVVSDRCQVLTRHANGGELIGVELGEGSEDASVGGRGAFDDPQYQRHQHCADGVDDPARWPASGQAVLVVERFDHLGHPGPVDHREGVGEAVVATMDLADHRIASDIVSST